MTYTQATQSFIIYLQVTKNYSHNTITNYTRYLQAFGNHINEQRNIEDITIQDIESYILALFTTKYKKKTLSLATQNYYLIALRSLFRYLIQKGHKVLAPDSIELKQSEKREVETLSREELERLLQTPNTATLIGKRDRAILEFLYSTGLRVSELCSLQKEHINLETQEFGIRGKGKKLRIVFVSERAKNALQDYLNHRQDIEEYVFIPHARKSKHAVFTPLSRDAIEDIVRKYRVQAGIIKRVTPHTLRHTFATELLINGADIRSVQEMLGHSSITTTQVYTHITHKRLKDIHKNFHK